MQFKAPRTALRIGLRGLAVPTEGRRGRAAVAHHAAARGIKLRQLTGAVALHGAAARRRCRSGLQGQRGNSECRAHQAGRGGTLPGPSAGSAPPQSLWGLVMPHTHAAEARARPGAGLERQATWALLRHNCWPCTAGRGCTGARSASMRLAPRPLSACSSTAMGASLTPAHEGQSGAHGTMPGPLQRIRPLNKARLPGRALCQYPPTLYRQGCRLQARRQAAWLRLSRGRAGFPKVGCGTCGGPHPQARQRL